MTNLDGQQEFLNVKIGLDAAPLNRLNGGIGYYIFHLLDALIPLHPRWTFFLYAFSTEGDIAYFKKYPNVVLRALPFGRISHTLWAQTILPYALRTDKIDVFWGTTQSIPLLRSKKIKNVLLLYDFVFHFFPQTVSSLKCIFLRKFTRAMIDKADLILSISQATADKLFALYAKRSDLILYPPLKSTIQFQAEEAVKIFLAPLGLEYKQYLLTIGTLEPRKNFLGLIDSYLHLLKKHPQLFPLVIVGAGGWKNAAIVEKLKNVQAEYPDKIKLLGCVSDSALSYLLSGARYYLCFSLYEGYGMPLAEARQCRTPIICFDQPEMREAAENDGIFLPLVDFEEKLEQTLLLDNPPFPSAYQYRSNHEKACAFSHALVDLLQK
jgi:glycosyltransferase involved in cell wall biosynthesis